MLILGAKGHAKELLDLLDKQNLLENIYFFDDQSQDGSAVLYENFPILKSINEVNELFKTDTRFILGIGGVKPRQLLYERFHNIGGKPISVISDTSTVGNYNVILGKGLNIMHNVAIFNDVSIGNGTLINSFASVHHDCRIGNFCEISPGARILGRATIGDFSSIGSNAVILPDVVIGENVVIGAGSVVTKHIPDNSTAIGVPAKLI